MDKLHTMFSLASFEYLRRHSNRAIRGFVGGVSTTVGGGFPGNFCGRGVGCARLSGRGIVLLGCASKAAKFDGKMVVANGGLTKGIAFNVHARLLGGKRGMLSFLPLTRTCKYTFSFLATATINARIALLNGAPSPGVLVGTFRRMGPGLVVAMPLIVRGVCGGMVRPLVGGHDVG